MQNPGKEIQQNENNTYMEINDTYIVQNRIGKGSFGEVFMGKHKWTGKPVAIKLEHLNSHAKILEHEYKVYKDVYKPNSGISECHFYGKQDDFSILIVDLLGKSLGSLLESCGGKFTLKTVLMIADQMFNRLEYLHEKNYIHRDLKPDNMLIGKAYHKNQIFLIDYGLAKKYRNTHGKHIPYREGGKLVGTARYASVNSHKGLQLSRRDDIISLCYILIFFAKGKLPWQRVKGDSKEEKYENILKCKETLPSETVCAGLPKEFETILTYALQLKFDELPDYNYMRSIFKTLFKKQQFIYDLQFDWSIAELVAAQDKNINKQ